MARSPAGNRGPEVRTMASNGSRTGLWIGVAAVVIILVIIAIALASRGGGGGSGY
ncbi:hypothetical protein GCM10010169_11760 [Micromonospora fulviviridis]|nr:hypothetical protein GCM10010169_11760 [Micromonospora fulviviridis]